MHTTMLFYLIIFLKIFEILLYVFITVLWIAISFLVYAFYREEEIDEEPIHLRDICPRKVIVLKVYKNKLKINYFVKRFKLKDYKRESDHYSPKYVYLSEIPEEFRKVGLVLKIDKEKEVHELDVIDKILIEKIETT